MRISRRLSSAASVLAALGILLLPVQRAATTFANGPLNTDIGLSVSAPASADRGNVFTQTVTVSNAGPADAHHVNVTVTPFYSLHFLQSGSDVACKANGSSVTCSLPLVAQNTTSTLALSFNTDLQDQCVPVSYLTDFAVQADETDPVIGNNAKISAVMINCTTASQQSSSANSAQMIEMLKDQQRQQARIQALMHSVSSASVSSTFSSASSAITAPAVAPAVAQNVSILLEPSRKEVLPGDVIAFTAHIQNLTNAQLTGMEVDFNFDPQQLQIVPAADAVAGNGTESWNVSLTPFELRNITFSLRAAPGVAKGTVIAAQMHILGVNGYPNTTVSIPVVGQMPQTGAAFFAPLENTGKFLSPVSTTGSTVLFVLIALSVVKYIIAGGLLTRSLLARR